MYIYCAVNVMGPIIVVLVCIAIGIGVHMGNRHMKP